MNASLPVWLRLSTFLITGLITGLIPDVAIAQSVTPTPSPDASVEDIAPVSTAASDLLIPARAGVGHTTSGGGFDGTTQFRGFIPLRQNPGQDITYFAPQFLLDNDGNIGGNLLFGHRAYSQSMNRIWGGYLSLDNRDTDESEFYQLGLGVETLGNVWDARINGYLPLGDTSQVIKEEAFDTGLTVSSGFEGNQLVLSNRREQRLFRLEEFALSGFDAEVGARIVRWNNNESDLRGLAGLYFYNAEEVDSTLGWRLGLEVRPVQNIVLGVTVQDDDLFGTNVIGTFALTFPRVRPKGSIPDEIEVAARLGEPVRRTSSIAVDQREISEVIIDETVMPLMNPEEEDPYRFIHVTLGRRGQGDGTVENPFGTVEEAIDDAISDGNNIIYVDAGLSPDIPAFTIPDRVRVLSQGPEQFLAGMPFPEFPELPSRLPFSPIVNFNGGILVEVPFSGDGNFPIIRDADATNLVTMGDRTVLSGFQLINAPENAVFADSVEDVEIRDNIIIRPGERGIYLSNVTGSGILFDNTITRAQGEIGSGQGIFIENTVSGSLEAAIQRHQIENNRVGIEILAFGDLTQLEDPLQEVEIEDTVIRNSADEGLVAIADSLGNQQTTFLNGDIINNGADGVRVQAFNAASQEFTIRGSRITGNAGSGLRFDVGVLNGSTTAAQENFITDNTISNNAGDGITITANEVSAQEFAITDNTITNNGGAGIRAVTNNLGFQEFVTDPDNDSFGLSGNTIANNGDVGIELVANDSATLVADIVNNDITNNETAGAPDLTVTATANTVDACTVLNGNASTTGIQLDSNTSGLVNAFFQVGDLSTLSLRNVGGITLLPDTDAFTDLGSVPSCFEN